MNDNTYKAGLQVFAFIAIAFFSSLILLLFDSILFLLFPFTTGLIAVIFVIRMIIKAIKYHLVSEYAARNSYIIGLIVIAVIEIIAIQWMMHIISRIRWM